MKLVWTESIEILLLDYVNLLPPKKTYFWDRHDIDLEPISVSFDQVQINLNQITVITARCL